MKPAPLSPCALVVLSCLVTCGLTRAAEPNPPPPSLTGVSVTTNGQISLRWTPVPAAEEFKVFSTGDLFSPFTENHAGTIAGYEWTGPADGPAGFHRLSTTLLSPDALLSATVLSRLTYGPTPADVAHIAAIGPQAFIDEQLASESITDTLDSDPPVINGPPPPLTNWIRLSVTGTTTGTNFGIYLSGPGTVYLDDIRLVRGTNADDGANLLLNGGFEDETLTNSWNLGSTVARSVPGPSPTVDGLASEGKQCVKLVASAGTTGLTSGLWQPFATNPPAANEAFSLGFSYLPVRNPSNTVLTVRLSGTAASRTVVLPPNPVTPPPPAPISPTYTKLVGTTASINDMRAYHVMRAVQSPRQLHEVLVQFFDNHFSTEYAKISDWFDSNYSNAITNDTDRAHLAVDLEWREHAKWRQLLLDPNCTFSDLLKVSVESPAMIIYLDTVANTKAAANENYARELLELHTFGADNGYVQRDIVDMAKIWTGWSVAKKDPASANNPVAPPVADPTNSPGIFVQHFRTNTHNYTSTKRLFTNSVVDARFGPAFHGGESYALIITNNAYAGTNGLREGYLVLDHLANQPYTMEFVSVKLCRTFVHEGFDFGIYDYTDPNLSAEAALVRDCMSAWDTPGGDGRKGNLRSVLRTIFNSALFRGHGASRQKIKTPLEFAVSAVRALRTVQTTPENYIAATAETDGIGITGTGNGNDPMTRMGGMVLFGKTEPDGYSESGRIWMNTANLCERMRFVQHLLMPTGSSTKDDDYGAAALRNTSDPVAILRAQLDANGLKDAGAVVDIFLNLLYPGEGRANLALDRAAAVAYLNANEAGAPSPFADLSVGSAGYDGRVRSLVGWLMCLPRFQEQ